MFKVESYISPYILGYINKYVKLKQEDFQLSLWGGDAVLNKLDLRLDVLEGALQLPISFKSGHIHELRLHVPWTKLGSEPVVITINTIECVLRLRDSASGNDDSASTKSGSSAKSQQLTQVKPKPVKSQEEEDLPPGYLQSLMNRILHNINIVVNNLILKFVEDDIVLSVNVKSAECYSVNGDWCRAFIELALPELVLRRVVDFHDLTVCLDKRNASGKIETYQDPLLYRCSLTCRLHMIYDNLHSKLPSVTKFNMLCEKLDLSLTDTQVPMFFRLVELCVALYYGTLELPNADIESDIGNDAVMVQAPPSHNLEEEGEQGWAAWAWSYVPTILPSGEYEEDEDSVDDPSGIHRKQESAILAIGIYINKASVTFKLSEYVREGPYYNVQKIHFRPCLLWECEAIGLEVLLQGMSFFNVQLGISGSKIIGLSEAMCGVPDLDQGTRDPNFLRVGLHLDTVTPHPHYHLSQSLFDPGGPENLGEQPKFIFDPEEHNQLYTEQYALQKYGAFWLDYLFTMEVSEEERKDKQSSSRSSHSNLSSSGEQNLKESSTIRFLLGRAQLNVCSSMVQRVHKFIYCMNQHDYEPYSKPKQAVVEESGPPKDEDVLRLEEYTPTRSYHFTMIQPIICIMTADLPEYDVSKKNFVSRRSKKSSKSKNQDMPPSHQSSSSVLPTLVIQADRFDLQLTSAMYPKYLVKIVSKLPAPSSNLIHHCHSHMYIKVFGLQAGLTAVDPSHGMYPLQSILQPCCGVYYKRSLLLPPYWKNPLQPQLEHTYELPQITLSVTKPQVMVIAYLMLSWQQIHPSTDLLQNISLLDDVFRGKHTPVHPVLEVGVSGLEVKHCDSEAVMAVTGTMTSVQAMILHSGGGVSPVTPVLYGPVNNDAVYNTELFTYTTEKQNQEEVKHDLLTFTLQLPKNPNQPQGPATLLADVGGVAICCDPVIQDWLNYIPVSKVKPIIPAVAKDKASEAVVDNKLSEAAIPLTKASESPSGSTVTNQTGSQTTTQSLTHTSHVPTVPKTVPQSGSTNNQDTNEQHEPVQSGGWGKVMSQLYPIIKMMQIQVDIRSWVIFLPEKHVPLNEPLLDIPVNMKIAMISGTLPDTMVLSLPSVNISCTGHKSTSPIQEIPIKSLEQSLAGEKLPWSVQLQQCSIYTIHGSSQLLFVLNPAILSATVAITTKYSSPLSDTILSLGLCIHADMETVTVKCSKRQLQLAFNLLSDYIASVMKVKDTYNLMSEIHEKANKTVASTDVNPPAAATTPQIVINKGHVRNPSSSGLLGQGDLGLTTITETSDTASRTDVTSSNRQDDEQVKLSLWLQWTLLRFVLKVYVETQGSELLLQSEMEELTTAIDVQDVFSKVRCKVGSFSVQHFIKRNGDWKTGSYQGIILSSNEQLSRNIPIAMNKVWTNQNEPSSQMFSHEDTKPPDSSLGFLTLTITQALQTNVQKRLQKSDLVIDATAKPDFDSLSSSKLAKNTSSPVYLNEICLTLQPCDIVVNCPVLAAVVSLLTLDGVNMTKKKALKMNEVTEGTTISSQPLFTSSNMPLLYFNIGHFRLIIPDCVRSKEDDLGAGSNGYSEQVQLTPESSVRNLSVSPQDMDMFVIQTAMISLKPHADNPLSRNVIDKDVYRQAVHSGITSLLGSDVEDRQYQVDVHGLSLSSGNWGELCSLSQPLRNVTKDPNVQNPALEWNTMRNSGGVDDIKLIPVASSFDLRIVAAPAIVYKPQDVINVLPVLVCGYSLEVNATTDMDYCLSVHQIQLLHQIYTNNIASVVDAVTKRTTGHQVQRLDPREMDLSLDSGVESEVSTLKSVQLRRMEPSTSSDLNKPFDWTNLTPFDILLTAGKISFMLYRVEQRKPEIKIVDIGSGAGGYENVKMLNVPMIVVPDATGVTGASKQSMLSLQNVIKPFVYAYFSQPHSLISCHEDTQKVVLSCFDVILKGCKDGYVITDTGKVIPEYTDYMVHWIETRPGRPDPKTGVPPSLYTLTIMDMFIKPAEVNLSVERPLKVNLSTAKLDQVIEFWNTLSSGILPKETKAKRNVSEASQASSDLEPSSLLKTLTWIGDLHLHMDQFVVAMELTSTGTSCIQLSVAHTDSDVLLLQNNKDYVQEVSCSTRLQDITVTTSYGNRSQALIGPLTTQVTVGLQWLPHSGPADIPQILLFIECGTVLINLGQEHVLCLEALANVLEVLKNRFTQVDASPDKHNSAADPKPKVTPSCRPSVIQRSFSDLERSEDDLRTGNFVFVSDDMGVDLLPAANEIVFGVDTEIGQATMTWCYPQPKILLSLKVTPVPFTLPTHWDASVIDETLRVPCQLQYWNVLERRFDTYCEFSLSENEATDVTLPEVTADFNPDLVISGIWRLLVLHPDGNQSPEGMTDFQMEPLVSPMTLAASVRVDSAFIPGYIPMMQCSFTSSLIRIHLSNHFTHLGQKVPSNVYPYRLDQRVLSDHEYAIIFLDQPSVAVSYLQGKQDRWSLTASGSFHCEYLEYACLTMQPLLDPAKVNLQVNWIQGKEWQKLKTDLSIDEVFVQISQSAVHTASMAVLAWKQLRQPEAEKIIPSYYIICNDTQETIQFGQVNTEENIVLQSREAHAYSWRSHKEKQMLQISTENLGWRWCTPLAIDNEGIITRMIESADNKATLVIRVKQISNCQKQVTISGQVIIASRLTRQLEIRLLASTVTTERILTLKPMEALPSYVIEESKVRAVKVKVEGTKSVWSQEITISTDKARETRLVKVPLQDKKGYFHIWCHIFCQQHKRAAQNLVIFTPLFVVRTQLPNALLMNIETPRLKLYHQVVLEGRGVEQQLHTMGGDMTHNLTFQLSPTMKPSSPAIALSSGLIDQVPCEPLNQPDIEHLKYSWHQVQGPVWPYNTELSVHAQTQTAIQHRNHQDIVISERQPVDKHTVSLPRGQNCPTRQPNIDLQINLSQLWAGCNTLLIDVVPYWMMDNQSGADLILIGRERGQDEDRRWKISQGQMFAPPVMEGPFRLGIMWGYMLHQSDPITLSSDDDRIRYLPTVPGLLYLNSSISITIPIVKDGMVNKICYLTLHSTVEHGMRVLTTRERYCLANSTKWPLEYMSLSLMLSPQKVDILGEKFTCHSVAGCSDLEVKVRESGGHPSASNELSLLLWDVPMSQGSLDEFIQATSKKVERVQYMTFRLACDESNKDHLSDWCHPVRIKVNDTGTRQTVALRCTPDGTNDVTATLACTVTTQIKNNVIYIVLLPDPDPPIHIHNNCHVSFCIGQTLTATGIPGAEVQEEAELTTSLHTVPGYSSYHYAFPTANACYPEISKSAAVLKLHFGSVVASDQSSDQAITASEEQEGAEVNVHRIKASRWSTGVDLESQHDTIVRIPDTADVKVHVEKVGYTTHVFVDPVSRIEISAKEIRSRIKGKETLVVDTQTASPSHSKQEACTTESSSEVSSKTPDYGTTKRPDSGSPVRPSSGSTGSKKRVTILELNTNLVVEKLHLTFIIQNTTSRNVTELLCVTAKDLIIIITPEDITQALTTQHTHYMQRLMASINNLQIDNQFFGRGSYDFPIVLIHQNSSCESQKCLAAEQFLKLSKHDKWKEMKKCSMIYATVQLCEDIVRSRTNVTRLKIASKPLALYIEDVFIYDIIKYIDRLIPTALVKSTADSAESQPTRLPRDIRFAASDLNAPIRLQHLSIEALSLLVSVHASLKLFIASDNTPLTFAQFEKTNIFTNSQQLIRTMAMYYASGALFRAGWVVGSLEILGSPTGLVRSIGNGVADLFRLPYEGFVQGPGAFVGGVTRGMGSLLKHVSTGTIMSITNFASSLSRNMEQLSLDPEHCERQKESRRHKPTGLSQGIMKGLSGLGLSLLGAVAGIADQPLQTLTQLDDPDEAPSTAWAATNIVTGVGKGLVGMVTKPIGGAAEFVSQTGMGLLQGTGLSQFPKQHHSVVDKDLSAFHNGKVKFTQKMLQAGPSYEILTVVLASQLATPADGSQTPDKHQMAAQSELQQVALLLTPEVLFIINETHDQQQAAFTLTDLECVEDPWDPCIIKVTLKESKKSSDKWSGDHDINNDRVAEFIDKAAQYTPIASQDTNDQSEQVMDREGQSDLVMQKTVDQSEPRKLKKSGGQSGSSKLRSRHHKMLAGPFSFQMDSTQRELFVAMFNIAINRTAGYGFPL